MPTLSDPMARGRTSEIFDWGAGRVLKLFLASYPRWWAEDEIRYQRAIAGLGLPTPAFYEEAEVDGRPGMVIERLSGRTLLDTLGSHPWRMGAGGRLLAELQAQVNACRGPEALKSQRALGLTRHHRPRPAAPGAQSARARHPRGLARWPLALPR